VALLQAIQSLIPTNEEIMSPLAVAGHSLGEYSALVASEVFDLTTAVRLVRRRGELMAAAREGTMAAVMGLDDETLDQICRDVSADTKQPVVIANYNAPGQLVISGATLAVESAGKLAKMQGARRVMPLKVSAAFHSPLMEKAARGMEEALSATTIHDPSVPLIANASALPITCAEDVHRELVAQVMSPVCWVASVQHMIGQGISTFVEIGPGNVLTGLIKRIAPGVEVVNIRDIDDVQAFVLQG
jgi:[acyl-carrier-protein] S-malonyltransferase